MVMMMTAEVKVAVEAVDSMIELQVGPEIDSSEKLRSVWRLCH